MKKYFMPVAAVMLALGFSAFTAPKSVKPKQTDEYMFWYFYDQGNDKLDGQIGDEEKTHLQAAGATTCDDDPEGAVECARGYELEQNPFQEEPAPGDDRVLDSID